MSSNRILSYLFRTPQRRGDGLNLRAWFAFYVFYLAVVCLVSNWGAARYATGHADSAKAVWLLGLYMFYFSLACTYVPLPTVWFVLLLASPAGGLTVLDDFGRVLTVAGLGATATAISHTNEYHVLAYLMRLGRNHRIRDARIYHWAQRQFRIWPFGLLVVCNILPIPADPARWLAILSGYPRGRYFATQWLGRFVRYLALGFVAESLELTFLQIIVISALLLVGSFVVVMGRRIRGAKRKVDPPPLNG